MQQLWEGKEYKGIEENRSGEKRNKKEQHYVYDL